MSIWDRLFGRGKKDFETLVLTVPEHKIYIYSDSSKFPYAPFRDKRGYWWPGTGDIHLVGKLQSDGMIDVPDVVLGHEEQHTLHRLRKGQIAHPHKDEDFG